MLISDLLRQQPKKKVCLIYNNKKITYGQLEEKSSEMAFAAEFIKKGEMVFLQEKNPVKLLLGFFAVIKAGGICVLANSEMPEKVCDELMNKYQIKVKVAFSDFWGNHKKSLPNIIADDIFLGAMSSGSTTGTPKIILRDHRSWMEAFPWQSKLFHINSENNVYLVGDLSYSANLNACIHTFFAGGCVIIAKNRLPQTWLADMDKYKVNAIFMVPAHYSMLLKMVKKINKKVTSLVTGGAKISIDVVQQLKKYFPMAAIVEYYGASELGHVSYAGLDDLLKRPESVGKLFPQVKAEVIDGVVWVESPYIIPAQRPRASAGDLGKIDDEGYLTLFGRKNGTINVGGVKIQPEQMEKVLKKYPFVEEAAVFSVHDKIRGEKIIAAIVSKSAAVKAKDIFHYCMQNMGYRPHNVVFLNKLPLNSSGKVDKISLKKLAEEKNL
ncbi:class I adenylate-forming enzyme family protein [Pectinatus sottacetonis]|uniref:class I adenylate-forming enzyme family protein n=1 Tax=Pectinatus sottacetonis TaxID=1002795 RepID=UPI0018C659A3|nr:AMP-binding protein [Pectinatus sottacetonis]